MTKLPEALQGLTPPYYLVDVRHLRGRMGEIDRAFRAHFNDVTIAYSYKTNYLPCVTATLHAEGAWAEVVSDLEYDLALRMGVPAERIVFNGPIKSREALSRALRGRSLVHIDSLDEAERIAEQLIEEGIEEPRLGFRVNLAHPEGEEHRRRSRFGLPAEDLVPALEALRRADATPTSIHGHLATKARSIEHFEGLVTELGEAAKTIGIDGLECIDVGGGFGYSPPAAQGRTYPSFERYAQAIHAALAAIDERLARKPLIVEPGMAMVNDAVRFVTRVESTKCVGGRNIAFVDGSVHTVKPTRHGLNLPVRVFGEDGAVKTGRGSTYDLVGYTCMDDDYIAIDQAMPRLSRGDRIEIANVGAYTLVFKPPFIRAMPATYALDGECVKLDCREQTFDDFFSCLPLGEGQ